MLISAITAPFETDGPRAIIETLMQQRSAAKFAAFAGDSFDNITSPISDATVMSLATFTSSSLVGGDYTELAYTTVGGRIEFTALSTDGLPNGRRFWSSMGQLVEDVFYGRIPELLSAKQLIVDQAASKVYWGTEGDLTSSSPSLTPTIILTGSLAKASTDFFE